MDEGWKVNPCAFHVLVRVWQQNRVGLNIMAESRTAVLSLGVLLVIIVVSILFFMAGLIDWTLVVPVIMVLSGGWLIVLTPMRRSKVGGYTTSAFSFAATGLVLISLGIAWYAFRFGFLYSVVIILLVLGGIAIVAALRTRK